MKTGQEPAGRRRSTARLAAVQALYEMDLAGSEADPVLQEFLEKRWTNSDGDDAPLAEPDVKLLTTIVQGVSARRDELDRILEKALTKAWPPERLETLLRAILRAGVYELSTLNDVPARVVITEYVDVAHAFFDGNERGLVNGVLDRLARSLRPNELEDRKGEQTAESR